MPVRGPASRRLPRQPAAIAAREVGTAVAAALFGLLLAACARCSELPDGETASPDLRIKIFVADLPEEYRLPNQWAKAGIHHSWFQWPTTTSLALPFGHSIPGGTVGPAWSTNQFSAALIAHEQVMQSPNRVSSFEEADVVYVPTLLGLMADVGGYRDDPSLETDMRALGQAFTDNLATLLPRVKEKPHFLVGNHESVCYQADGILTSPLAPYLTLWATALWTEIPLMARSLALPRGDPARLMHLTSPGRDGLATAGAPRPGFYGNLIPMPYPSYVHHYRGCDTCNLSAEVVASLKRHDVFAAFELRKHLRPGPWSIREHLLEQCRAKPEQCVSLSAKSVGSDSGILELVRGMEQSWFCLQPHGDTPSRKAVYDSLLLGCIPVVFDRYVLETFPFAEVLDPSRLVAYVPRAAINRTNIIDVLNRRYPPPKRQSMLAHILAVKHVFQWSLSSDWRPLRWDELGSASPHDDAFSMLLKRTVEGGCRRGFPGMRHCELVAAGGSSSRRRAGRLKPERRRVAKFK